MTDEVFVPAKRFAEATVPVIEAVAEITRGLPPAHLEALQSNPEIFEEIAPQIDPAVLHQISLAARLLAELIERIRRS